MKERLVEWLACPDCGGTLTLGDVRRAGGEIHEGTLTCGGCARPYRVVRGIPRLLPQALSSEATATAERFGYEWTRFAEIRPLYESQFLGWIAPVGHEAFQGRRVLDAGCGKGRHLRLAAAFGARDVIGVDLGDAVEAAARNTADLPNVHVVQGDLTRPPFQAGTMEMAYSIGVLHHLRDPAAGVRALVPLLAKDAPCVVWVYGREGNGWVLGLVNPVRKVTSRLPLSLVSALALIATVPLWVALRTLYGPARTRPGLRRLLPYRGYLTAIAEFPFREVHSIAFDQLLAPVAHYMARPEVERCFASAGLELRSLRWHNENSWAACGVGQSLESTKIQWSGRSADGE